MTTPMFQSTFLDHTPVHERIFVGHELGREITIEHIPPGLLPENYEALGLPDGEDLYIMRVGEDVTLITHAAYEGTKAVLQRQ